MYGSTTDHAIRNDVQGADCESSHYIANPSEDLLFGLIGELNDSDNTFVVTQADEDNPAWLASAAVIDEGGLVSSPCELAGQRWPAHRVARGELATSASGGRPSRKTAELGPVDRLRPKVIIASSLRLQARMNVSESGSPK